MEQRYSPVILKLDARWGEWSGLSSAALTRRRSRKYPWNMKQSGPQSRSGVCGKETKPSLEPNYDSSVVQPLNLISVLTKLSRITGQDYHKL